MQRKVLALLAVVALAQASVVLAVEDPVDNKFGWDDLPGSDLFEKFLLDLNNTWHGLFDSKHHKPTAIPTGATAGTGATGDDLHHMIKHRRRLATLVDGVSGATGTVGGITVGTGATAATGPKEAIRAKVEAKVEEAIQEKEAAKASVVSFFEDAIATLRERLAEGRGAILSAVQGHGEKLANVTSGIRDRVAIKLENSRLTADAFLQDVLGKNVSDYFPKHFNLSDWANMGGYEFDNSIANFIDGFPKNISDFRDINTGALLFNALQNVTSAFCTRERITPSVKLPTTCSGPGVTLELVPKTCVIDSITKTLICDPAKLVITKFPGECVLKHHTAFVYVGHQCRITATVGLSKTAVLGGQQFSVVAESLAKDVKDFVVARTTA